MENYRQSAHCTYDIKYHIVWITKYRKLALAGKIAERTRELIRMVCQFGCLLQQVVYVGVNGFFRKVP